MLVCAALPCLAGCETKPPHAGMPTIQAQSMQVMLADVERVRAYVYGGGDTTRGDAVTAATDLVSWSRRMGELFPPGQASTDYVDMDQARVRSAPEAMTSAAERLLAVVRTGNRAAIGDQLRATERDGCGFCHLNGTQ